MNNMLLVDKIDTIEAFKQLQINWDELYRQDLEADCFLSWGWLSKLYECSQSPVLILGVKESACASKYCAFLPLLQDVRFSKSRNRYFNSLSMAGSNFADSTGLICDRHLESFAIPVLTQALKGLSWQGISFSNLKISTHRQALLLEGFPKQNYSIKNRKSSMEDGELDQSVSPFVELPETFELYLEHKADSNIRDKMRELLTAIGGESSVRIELADADSIDAYLELFKHVHTEGNVVRQGQSTEQLASMRSDLVRSGVRSGDMLFPVLLQEGRPVGFFACYKDLCRQHLYFYMAGYDAEFETLHGGLILHAYCIEWAINNEYTRYHLLRGNEPHKYLLGAVDEVRKNISIYKRTPSPATQLLHRSLKKPALLMLEERRKSLSKSSIHEHYSQLLESWPNDLSVLRHYESWLNSVKQYDHANEINRYIANAPSKLDGSRSADLQNRINSIDVGPYLSLQQWLQDLVLKQQDLAATCLLSVKGLKVEVASSDIDYIDWLKSYLYPLFDCSGVVRGNADIRGAGMYEASERSDGLSYRFNCINASELVVQIMRLASSDAFEINSLKIGGRRIERLYLSSELIIDICRLDGVVWVADNSCNQLTLLLSSRTTWPSLEVSRTARALIIAYLQHDGWFFLHSGAVRIEGKNYLVIGDEGQGKTSLILALMSAGCEYISNERVFARQLAGKVEALSFPMPVAVGMGTAQQYPEIMTYVRNPECCLYPNRRMNVNKLRSTPESQWSSLNDKVQFLVPELNTMFGHDEAAQGGLISGVIVPSIVRDGSVEYKDEAILLESVDLKKVVARNHISLRNDSRYPAWLPLAFDSLSSDSRNELTDTLCSLPGVKFRYFATHERKAMVMKYPEVLRNALYPHDTKST